MARIAAWCTKATTATRHAPGRETSTVPVIQAAPATTAPLQAAGMHHPKSAALGERRQGDIDEGASRVRVEPAGDRQDRVANRLGFQPADARMAEQFVHRVE